MNLFFKALKKINLSRVIFLILFIANFSQAKSKKNIENSTSPSESKTFSVHLGVYPLPPHVSLDESGLSQGLAVNYIQKLAHSLNWNLKITSMPFARILAELEIQNLDMAILVAKTPERERKFLYSNQPLVQDNSCFISMTKDGWTLDKIKNSKTPITIGHAVGSVIPPYLKDLNIHWDFLSGNDYFKSNISRLLLGRVQAVFAPTMSHANFLLKKEFPNEKFFIEKIKDGSIELFIVYKKNFPKQMKRKADQFMMDQGRYNLD